MFVHGVSYYVHKCQEWFRMLNFLQRETLLCSKNGACNVDLASQTKAICQAFRVCWLSQHSILLIDNEIKKVFNANWNFVILLLLVELDRHIRYSYFIILFVAWYISLAPYNPASLIALWCTFITHIERIKEVKINSRNVQKLLSKYKRWYGNLNIPNI